MHNSSGGAIPVRFFSDIGNFFLAAIDIGKQAEYKNPISYY
jgi:hypothetical protein